MSLLSPNQLAERWQMSSKTLAQWRWKGIGPKYVKLGPNDKCSVRYRVEDVEAFERASLSEPAKVEATDES